MIIQTNLQRSLGIVAAALLLPNLAVAASHPLDPLSAEEIRAATAALRADPRLTDATIPLVTLDEPAKGTSWGGCRHCGAAPGARHGDEGHQRL